MMVLVYVDDIAAASKDSTDLDWFYTCLSSRFETNDLGEISKILGMRIERDRKNKTLYLDQQQYLEGVLQKFGFKNAKSNQYQFRVQATIN